MKKMRRLIPAIAMLLVSAVMLSTASFAWFTISTDAQATGMSVSAVADSSLLIVTSHETTAAFLTSTGVATFDKDDAAQKGTSLLPATHYKSADHKGANGATLENVSSGLVYLTDTSIIDPSTGLPKTDTAPVYAAADGKYYKDFIVYLGTAGGTMAGNLTATVKVDGSMAQLHNAVAIDFLTATATKDNQNPTAQYVTVEVEDEDGNKTTKGATTWLELAKAETGVVVDLGAVTIPETVKTAEGETVASYTGTHFVVVMRVYFDGAYIGSNGTSAYVKDAYKTDNFCGFNVNFHIEKTTTNSDAE